MSEKRFVLFGLDNETIKDDVTKECYWVNEYVQRKKLVDLLNEQQATITNLQGEVERLKYIIEELRKDNYKRFEKINELKAKLKEKE